MLKLEHCDTQRNRKAFILACIFWAEAFNFHIFPRVLCGSKVWRLSLVPVDFLEGGKTWSVPDGVNRHCSTDLLGAIKTHLTFLSAQLVPAPKTVANSGRVSLTPVDFY